MVIQDRIPRSVMLSMVAMVLVCAGVPFGAAGRLDIVEFWCWIIELAAICVATILLIEPDLLRERMRPAGQRLSLGYYLTTLLCVVDLAVGGWAAAGCTGPTACRYGCVS
jgi:hypothetical protein